MVSERNGHGPAIIMSQLCKAYGGNVAVDNVTIDIAGGSFLAIVGASGSGKSTLLKMVNRLIEPDGGRIMIGDRDIAEQDIVTLRRSIGYVLQGTGLFPHMDIARNIAIGLHVAGQKTDRDAVRYRVEELLDLVELPHDFAARMPATLSGGQQQRAGFARALATAPGLMLMDEPFGALDPVTRDALGRAYRGLHDRLGLTSIMVTHDMAEALLLADRIIVMDKGRVVADGTARDLLAGGAGEIADALIAVPRAQAELIKGMLP